MIPAGQAFCRHCGAYLDKDERGNVSHRCPDGHLESRFVTGDNRGPHLRERIYTLDCGCTMSVAGRWDRKEAQHIERRCCHPIDINCPTHGHTFPVRVHPYLPLYVPVPA